MLLKESSNKLYFACRNTALLGCKYQIVCYDSLKIFKKFLNTTGFTQIPKNKLKKIADPHQLEICQRYPGVIVDDKGHIVGEITVNYFGEYLGVEWQK